MPMSAIERSTASRWMVLRIHTIYALRRPRTTQFRLRLVAIDPLLDYWRRVALHLVDQSNRVAVDHRDRAVLAADESFSGRLIEKVRQQAVVAADVEERDRLLMHPELRPCPDFENFFEGTEAAGKS